MLSKTEPLGYVSRYQYDAVGNLTTITNTLGFAESTVYDALNRPIASTVGRK